MAPAKSVTCITRLPRHCHVPIDPKHRNSKAMNGRLGLWSQGKGNFPEGDASPRKVGSCFVPRLGEESNCSAENELLLLNPVDRCTAPKPRLDAHRINRRCQGFPPETFRPSGWTLCTHSRKEEPNAEADGTLNCWNHSYARRRGKAYNLGMRLPPLSIQVKRRAYTLAP